MNTKSRKKHKGANYCETKPDNEGTEVFVLPPNLLEKLGIKLDNIVSTETQADQKPTADVDDRSLLRNGPFQEECFKTPRAVNKKNESSILETASLMKESVFLSPTFVPTVANIIPGELEIVQSFEQTPICADNLQKKLASSDNFFIEMSTKQIELPCKQSGISKCQSNSLNTTDINYTNKIEQTTTANNAVSSEFVKSSEEHSKNTNEHVTEIMKTSKNPSSQLSQLNSPSGRLAKTDHPNNSNSSLGAENKKSSKNTKIKVINEEVVNISKLYKRKSLNTNVNNNVLTPISVDMLLPSTKHNKNTLSPDKVEKNDDTQKVVSLLHDIGKADTIVTQSEKLCDLVVKHVNGLCVNNESDMLNHSIEDTSLMDVFTEIDNNNELSKFDKVPYEHINDIENIVDNFISGDEVDPNRDSKLKEVDSHNFLTVVEETNICNQNDLCEETADSYGMCDNVSNDIDHSQLENLGKFELFFEKYSSEDLLNSNAKSFICNVPIDLEMPKETNTGKLKDNETKPILKDINELCYIINIENENVNDTKQDNSEKCSFRTLSCEINRKEIDEIKLTPIKSKLSIQGVEKPGGETEDSSQNVNALKSHGRIKEQKSNIAIYAKDQGQSLNEMPESNQSDEKDVSFNKNSVLRTYNRQKKCTKINIPELSQPVRSAKDMCEINETISPNTDLDRDCKGENFCLCGDFGLLKYYDYDSSYEHIHFWKHTAVTSDCDLIFSMYDTDSVCNNDNADKSMEIIKESPDECFDKICWNDISGDKNYGLKIDDDMKEVDLNEYKISIPEPTHSETSFETNDAANTIPEVLQVAPNANQIEVEIVERTKIDTDKSPGAQETSDIVYNTCLEITNTNDQDLTETIIVIETESTETEQTSMPVKNRVKKRKTSAVKKEETSTDVTEPQCKKDLKCGVCNLMLAKEEWDTHSSKEHGLIAWKAGEHFDFEDKDLLVKVKQKLKDEGVLKCRFCSIEFNVSKRYIIHVQECLKTHLEAISKKVDPKRVSKNGKKSQNENVECGVCNQVLPLEDWQEHSSKEHELIAWKAGEKLDFEDRDLRSKIKQKFKEDGILKCRFCDTEINGFKRYMLHVQECMKTNLKRKSSKIEREQHLIENIEPPAKKDVKCGVCNQVLAGGEWEEHSAKEHGFIAWKAGENIDFEDKDLLIKIKQKLKEDRVLACRFCSTEFKVSKQYLVHAQECMKSNEQKSNEEPLVKVKKTNNKIIECGVCNQMLDKGKWEEHSFNEHGLIAWKAGEKIDFRDRRLINKIKEKIKENGIIKCGFCDSKWNHSKRYTLHVQKCLRTNHYSGSDHIQVNSSKSSKIKDSEINSGLNSSVVTCGVCSQHIKDSEWILHICQQHNYLAWKDGENPLNLDDEDILEKHLQNIIRAQGPIICSRCGFDRKYGFKAVKIFLQHIKTCNKVTEIPIKEENIIAIIEETRKEQDLSPPIDADVEDTKMVKCGVCEQEVPIIAWIDHIGKEHHYLAWKEGEPYLDLDDEEEVKQHLYNINKEYDGLICSKCGIKRKYVKKFLSHIESCDGTGSIDDSIFSNSMNESRSSDAQTIVKTGKEIIKCGVCMTSMTSGEWYEHIGKQHNYIAWKLGDTPVNLDDEEEVKQHLNTINKEYDGLICTKCGIKRKYVKKFLSHTQDCDGKGIDDSFYSNSMNESRSSDAHNISQTTVKTRKERVKCGVCMTNMAPAEWYEHIGKQHNYIAWKLGDTPLMLKTDDMVEGHLLSVMKENGSLACPKCGAVYNNEEESVKTYMSHVKDCQENLSEGNSETQIDNSSISDTDKPVKCGVCGEKLTEADWIQHIESKHNYMAWKDGEEPLDLSDIESIRLYLFTLTSTVKAFKCSKCGILKKYPKSFITHVEDCTADSDVEIDKAVSTSATCVCAVCSAIVDTRDWRDHAMDEHYNIAWKVGEYPIDLKSPYGTEKSLKEYKQRMGKMVCKICGTGRASVAGFYAHILACGKTEEELDEYRNLCEICNCKYLCIYKNQHIAYHREQEYAKERKQKAAESKIEDNDNPEAPAGRRMAAVKASTVIEKLKNCNQFKHTCPTCGFETDSDKKLARHKCVVATFEENSNSESEASEEFDEDPREADLSAEEEMHDTQRRRKNKESMVQAKVPKVPFKYTEVSSYVNQSKEDFYAVHFTSETLFPQWRTAEYDILSDEHSIEYLPSDEKSCQTKMNREWTALDRFEAKEYKKGCYAMFVGASVQCLSWAPPHVDHEADSVNYLAISCHRGYDSPRLNYDEVESHNALIQIWDFGHFDKQSPKFVMGLAHDYGTIWAMDWCPSGVRDMVTQSEGKDWARLGLLAVACSNGLVYVLSVPYPGTVAESGACIKLKPVAELKLSMRSERKVYQATAISWSKQKGHAFVSVGYSDGTVALYDLNVSSPLLQCTENGITVFYPYHDEREHNVAITDLDTWAGATMGSGPRAVCSGSVGGAAAVLRPAAPLARLMGHAAATGCRFAPGWPSVMLAVDDALASQSTNELDWYGCGRRLGPVRACCACARCGRALLFAPPLLRTLQALPPYADLRKQNILGIRSVSLKKKKEKVNDELGMRLEPLTYDDVIKQYGVEIFVVDANDKNNSINTVKEQWTERFPLSDVTSMAFCPSEKHHQKVVVGVQSGLVLLHTL